LHSNPILSNCVHPERGNFGQDRGVEYEQKCEQIATQIEMFVLDRIIAALERLNYYLQPVDIQSQISSEDTEPF
jgi:hypothetical protein